MIFKMDTDKTRDITEQEIAQLLEVVKKRYGYDFTNYSQAHIKRRIVNRMMLSQIEDINFLIKTVDTDELMAANLLQDLSITVTEMFRDPPFYQSVREHVILYLKTYPYIKIWHAGCSTGEEVYSMAILLQEEGVYDRTTIYATDFNARVLKHGKEGIYSHENMRDYTANYQRAGGKESFSKYYTSSYDHAIMDQSLKKNIVWANHNLVTDSVFAEVHMVICRNVLIYFNRDLQSRVQQLFYDSLVNSGILCLGSKESLRFTHLVDQYSEIDKKYRIFKKRYQQ